MYGIITTNNEYNNRILKIIIKLFPFLIKLYIFLTCKKISYEIKLPFIIARIPVNANVLKCLNNKVLKLYYNNIYKKIENKTGIIDFFVFSKILEKKKNNNTVLLKKDIMLIKLDNLLKKVFKIYEKKKVNAIIIDDSFSFKSLVIIKSLKEYVKYITLITNNKNTAENQIKYFENKYGISIWITNNYNILQKENALIFLVETNQKINNNKSVLINFEFKNNYNDKNSYIINALKVDITDKSIKEVLLMQQVSLDSFICNYMNQLTGNNKKIMSLTDYKMNKKMLDGFINIKQII